MRIVSYNIRKAVGLDWRRDPDRIVDVLLGIDADIVVLQEADRRTGRRAGVLPLDRMAAEGGYALVDIAERNDSHGWHGNAIFARRAYSIAASRRLALPRLEPRGAVSARLASPGLEIIGTHLALLTPTRRRQVAHLRRHASEASHPVVIAGDFNAWHPARSGLLDGFTCLLPGPSFHAASPRVALDGFLLSRDIAHRAARVEDTARARRASDHLPVVLDLDLPRAAS